MKVSDLQDKLRSKKLKITPQRLEVLRAIEQLPGHSSVDIIYRAVKKRHPTVSLATVYKTLETLVEIAEIRVALVADGKARYDVRLGDHHHFLCSSCGYIEDVEVTNDCIGTCGPKKSADGKLYRVDHSELIFHGLCPSCERRTLEKKET